MTAADVLALYDGDWFDVVTGLGGVSYAVLNRLRAPAGRDFWSIETGADFVNGLAVVPLCFLALSLISSHAVTDLMQHSRLSLFTTAVVSLFAVLKKS